ncbi:D-aminoacylase [Novosphingobium sp. BL-8A]|uniref:N-acyl-D-amino-acid deacylase family protein n=1 Tax=Novosphingobium sp. BL-8A TaxID=3127639 RepID=UPI003756B9BA
MKRALLALAFSGVSLALIGAAPPKPSEPYDLIVRGGTIYDGSGGIPFRGDLAIRGDRIVAVAAHVDGPAKAEIDASGKAVSPGFINMLAHPEQSLLIDGRALSDLAQGVTLEVMGEISMGPLSPAMKKDMIDQQGDYHYDVDWTTLGEYFQRLEARPIAPNVASFVSAGTVREAVLGANDVQPDAAQLATMQRLVREAMEQGALGLTDALIYTPATFAHTDELKALAKVSAQCGGIYTVHMRSEGDRIEQAVQETIDIAEYSGAPAEIYHFKLAGRDNWGKFDSVVGMIEAARARGTRISANMYNYTAGATGLDAAMPPWVQAGGYQAWAGRLKDPATRAKVVAEMRTAHPADWENLYAGAGPEGTILLAFKNPALKSLTGKSLAEVAKMRGKSPEETAMDLVVEDGTRVGVAYFLMSEDNVRRSIRLPWMSFGSDEEAPAPEGVFLLSKHHPRAYGNVARLLGHYVRDTKDLTLAEAVRRLTSLPADNLSLGDRGRLKPGMFADVVVFDPATITDHATYDQPEQLSTGVSDVIVNGRFALRGGKATGAATGRIVRGRAAQPGGSCRASAADWKWRS